MTRCEASGERHEGVMQWYYDPSKNLFVTEPMGCLPDGIVLDALPISANEYTGVLSFSLVVTISSAGGDEVLVLGAGAPDDPLYLAPATTAVIGLTGPGFEILRHEGYDLILVTDPEVGDRVHSVLGFCSLNSPDLDLLSFSPRRTQNQRAMTRLAVSLSAPGSL
jgi:hypothetical protein